MAVCTTNESMDVTYSPNLCYSLIMAICNANDSITAYDLDWLENEYVDISDMGQYISEPHLRLLSE